MDTKTGFQPGMLRGAGKAVALADAIDRGTQAVTDFQQGDNLMGGYNALRAGAGVMAARGDPVAAAFVGGSMAGDLIGKALPEDVRMGIGAATNAVVRKAGDLVGQKWGVDDSALTDGPGASNTARSPLKAPQAGRSTVLNTTNYKAPDSPSASAFDRTNDVRTAINTGQIPDSLRDGRIWNSGNMYTGMNVKAGAPITDAQTGMNRASRGTFNVVDDSARREYYANVLRGSGGGGGGGSDTTRRDFSLDLQGLLKQLERQPGEPSYRYRARTAAINEAVQNYVNLENNRRIVGATLRGQDMELQGRLLPKQLELEQARQLRALQGEFFRAAGGDTRKAAALAASAGMPELAKSFYDLAEGSQKYSQGANKTALESLKSHATPDEKGNITEAEEARLRRRVESAVPGYLNMSENERLAYQPEADGTLSLIRGINARRNHRLSQAIGLDAPDPEFDRLPDLRGGKLGEVGFFEGLSTPQVQRGDYYVELPNDQKIYIGRDSLTENARELLKKRSVSTSALRD